MKRSTFSEEQIVYAIRQAESYTPVSDLCRQRVPAYRNLDVSIPACVALVHDFCAEHRVEGEHIPRGHLFLVGMALNMAKPCKRIQLELELKNQRNQMNKSDERERRDSGLVYLVEEKQRDLESTLGGLACWLSLMSRD
jgi:hypothetical protein